MSRIYITTESKEKIQALESFCLSLSDQVEWVNASVLRFDADPQHRIQLNLMLESFQADLGILLGVVAGFDNHELMMKALETSMRYGSGQVMELSDLLILSGLHQDNRLMDEARRVFEKVNPDVLETARVYLLAGSNAKLAAQELYLHRNTFNYRLNKFREITKIDLREPLLARFMQTYLLISMK